ncbi:MAG: MBL fold metallo-hydrolase [Defluviitaleaceae bacterium]|nr:MBL fold metallo-hydrolase [Defluviitaleaceae bacterium]
MKIYKTDKNHFGQNTFLYYDDVKKKGIIIDPGLSMEEMAHFIEENEIEIEKVLITHYHFDHIAGFKLGETFSKETYGSLLEKEQLESPQLNGSIQYLKKEIVAYCKTYLSEGDEIAFLDTILKVIVTPGHSHGHVCFYDKKNDIIFSGDTLFKEGVGRTDLPGGNANDLVTSIKTKLYTLPEETIVYPGHGDKTTIGHEKRNNPFVKDEV